VLAVGPVWVDVSVPPDEPVGDGYLIDVSGTSIVARLLARGRMTDSDGTRHVRLIVDPRAAKALSPGSSVPVHVARGASRGVVLPESALVPGLDGDTVSIETAPNVYPPRAIGGGRAVQRAYPCAFGCEGR